MSRRIKLILTIIVAVLAVAIITGGIITVVNILKKNRQAKCDHEYGEIIIVKDSTCENVGLTLQICKHCDYELTGEKPSLGHTEKELKAKPSTCTEVGLTDGIYCSTCGKVIVVQLEVPALGHNVIEDEAITPTCTQSGLAKGSHCKRCGEITKVQDRIPATGHSLVVIKGNAATCTSSGLTNGSSCEKCGTVYTTQETIDPTGHNFVEGVCENCGLENTTPNSEV